MGTHPEIWLGLDCGGTNTRVALAAADGRVLARGMGPAANPHRVGVAAAAEAIASAVRVSILDLSADTVAANLVARDGFGAVAVGLAGRSHPEASAAVARGLAAWRCGTPRLLVDDGALARAAAFGSGAGVLLVSGTGSAAWGKGPLGEHRCGGLGPSIGDAGSGHDLGMRALRGAAALWDRGCAVPAWLTPVVPLSPRTWEAALRDGSLRAADLAPLVVAAADAGDPEAGRFCAEAARELAGLASNCLARCGLLDGNVAGTQCDCVVATTGSVALALRPWLAAALHGQLGEHVEDALPGAFALLRAADATVPPGW